MSRQKHIVEGLLMEEDASKIRKRGCSPSSPSSSILHNYRCKKAVLVGKRGGGSSTPVPSWRIVASRSPSISLCMAAAEQPRRQSGRSTAQIPQPVSARKLAAKLWELNEVPIAAPAAGRRRRRVDSVSGPLPPHLSDPSHSPVSERSDRSKSRTHRRRQSSSVSRRLNNNALHAGVLDSVSNASFMEIETRSICQSQTPAGSTSGFRNHLKDVSNALTTSKELLKIISRMWGQQDYQPSTSLSLISALHTELERARLQVNQLVQEQRSDQNEISYLVKCFAEEKAAWKNKEKQSIKAAIESVVGELEVERKLRRRVESLNKKLGKELAEIKAALFSNPKAEVEENETAEQLRDELQDFLRDERGKEKVHHASINHTSFGFNPSDKEEVGNGEVEDLVKFGDDSAESDLHSIEINMKRISKDHKSRFGKMTPRNLKKLLADDELMSRGLRRSTSNVVNCNEYGERLQFEKQCHRRSCGDDLQRYKTVEGRRDQIMCSSRLFDLGSDRSLMIEEGKTRERLEEARVCKNARRSGR